MYPVLVDPDFGDHEIKYNPDFHSNYTTHQNFGREVDYGEVLQNPDYVDQKPYSNAVEIPDFSDACLKFLGEILLEEDLDETPISVQGYEALQATEKSLYDALGEEYSPTDGHLLSSVDQYVENPSGSNGVGGYGNSYSNYESNLVLNQAPLEPFLSLDDLSDSFLQLNPEPSGSSNSGDSENASAGRVASPISTVTSEAVQKVKKTPAVRSRRKNQRDDGGGYDDGRSNKQQASSNEDYVEMEQYDDILLCKEGKDEIAIGKSVSSLPKEASEKLQKKGSKGRTTRGKKLSNVAEGVDLLTLLNHCAQAVSSFDLRSANERLKQIRQHASQYGTSIERLAYYSANALEARIAGTGSTVSSNIVDAHISSSDFLKSYKVYVQAIPFKRMSFFMANNTIRKMAETAKKVHIIDFGILLGLQWPCFIQALSRQSGGAPKLRITGVDYPQQGFRPAERVEATGHRLAGYCERFNVPFKYQAIAKKWGDIQPEELKIESDELVVVNCMYRSGTLLDETVEADSSKDAFLKLVKQLNPHLFIHGVVNGTFNAPFFVTRFKEALFHYSSIFDIFEATMPREDHARLLIESEIYGKEAMNVIACEGAERMQRPESYKQWQVRTTRGGFRQLQLDRELLSRAKVMARANYHQDFLVDEDRHWMLQGWKGRIFCALSLWQS